MNHLFVVIIAFFSMSFAQAESIKEIFEDIAKTAPTGNGDGHHVTRLKSVFSVEEEVSKLQRLTNHDDNECRYDILTGVKDGIETIRNDWNDSRTASRLEGMAEKKLLREIIYSSWDVTTGDGEYCSMASIKVYGVDDSVLVLDYNETD